MPLSDLIAFRYLFSKKSTHAINLISGISVIGFGVGAFAIIIVLSTMNGFEHLVSQMVNNFDAELKISHKEKKVFKLNSNQMEKMNLLKDVEVWSSVLEDKAVVMYNGRQEVVQVKGIQQNALEIRGFDSSIITGGLDLQQDSVNLALFGSGVANSLGISVNSGFRSVEFFVPKRTKTYRSINPMNNLNYLQLWTGGIFQIHPEIDDSYVLCGLSKARKLFGYKNAISSVEVMVSDKKQLHKVKNALKEIFGSQFWVETQKEQNRSLYKIFKSEKWISFSILTFILLIAGFNLIGNLSMLVFEKKHDLAVLKSLGMGDRSIQLIFLKEGFLVSLLGGIGGLSLGLLLLLAHQYFGLLKLEGAVVDYYPVKIIPRDILIVLLSNLALGFLLSIYPSINAPKNASF